MGTTKYTLLQKQDKENRLALLLLEKGFLYIGGYDGKYSTITVSCTTCGGTFTRYADMRKETQTLKCPLCEERRLKPIRQARAEKHQEQLKRKADREAKIRANEERLDKKQICKCCGKEFTLREYRAKEQTNRCEFTVYCSSECRERESKEKLKALREFHRNTDHKARAIKFGCDYEKGVTLKRLIKRDGLRCAICGGMCDLNDRSYGNGNGPLYPSIDHIKPMSKQGGHTWDNVQIAHIICNTRKNAKVEERYDNVS